MIIVTEFVISIIGLQTILFDEVIVIFDRFPRDFRRVAEIGHLLYFQSVRNKRQIFEANTLRLGNERELNEFVMIRLRT